MSSPSKGNVKLVQGDLLESMAHALVNTVNCEGVMGKGVALAFKKRYPLMFKDYVERCSRDDVQLGRPYPFEVADHIVINFPTKKHWRSLSRLEDIEEGLDYLKDHLDEWGIESLAVPPLGCGNGQLDWAVVGPTLVRHLESFERPVELFVPSEMGLSTATELALFDMPSGVRTNDNRHVSTSALALVEVLRLVESEEHHWPVGRIMFQKLAYFATAAGVPTELSYEPNSYGPYAPELKRIVAELQNNGLVVERKRGRMFETVVGPTFEDARKQHADTLNKWSEPIGRAADLMIRFDSSQAEIAATVHYAATALQSREGEAPFAADVIDAVERWKVRRKPPIRHDDIVRSLVSLATQAWIEVVADESVEYFVDDFLPV